MNPVSPRSISDYENAYLDSSFETVQAAFRKRLLMKVLDDLQPVSVLEVGCGMETLACHWTSSERFVVVEPGATFAAEARRATAGRQDVSVLEDMFEAAVPKLKGDFDLILLSGLLHEVVDCDALLAAARGLSGPGTVVHVNVPNAHSFHRLLALEMGLIKDVTQTSQLQKTLQQQRTFSMASLEALARSHGFEAEDRGGYFVKPFTHAQMQALKDNGFLTEAMLEGLWGMAKHMPELCSEIYINLRPV